MSYVRKGGCSACVIEDVGIHNLSYGHRSNVELEHIVRVVSSD